jgi:hydroxypyruvate reductase
LRLPRLRADTEAILRAGIAGAAPGPLLQQALGQYLIGAPVHLLAIGKAAASMARAAYQVVPVRAALVVAPQTDEAPWPEPAPRLLAADHPIPGQRSVEAARVVQAFLERLTGDDVVLVLLSGGGSSLLALPAPGLTLHDLAATTRMVMAAGAGIHALNCVRRHLDDVKGGRLARLAAPATVHCLALSDVPGDDPAAIASGPFTPDPTTFGLALTVLREHALLERVPRAVRLHLEAGQAGMAGETLKPGDRTFRHVHFEIIGSNRQAREAAAQEATRRGYRPTVSSGWLDGEARNVGERLGKALASDHVRQPQACVYGGETTVTVRGSGLGGRNQELALAAAAAIAGVGGVSLGTVGTDGIDGASPAAGAIVDGTTARRLRARGLDIARALAANDSYSALAAIGDALTTGPTGTNVMDLTVTVALP